MQSDQMQPRIQFPAAYIESRQRSSDLLEQIMTAISQGKDSEAVVLFLHLNNRMVQGEALPEKWQNVKGNIGPRF